MLTLPIKKKWYDMILSEEKKEEYREIKPYYTTRFRKLLYISESFSDDDFYEFLRSKSLRNTFNMRFRNGYSANSPTMTTKIVLSIGTGKLEWGAELGKEYYVLRILEVRE